MGPLMLDFVWSYAGVLIGLAVIGCGDEGKPAGETDGVSDVGVEALDVAVEPEADVAPEADLAVETEVDTEAETEADAAETESETQADVEAEAEADVAVEIDADADVAVEIDAEADVPVETDVVSGQVAVTVIDWNTGLGLAGAAVMFSRADGALIAAAPSDATGKATATMEAGGSVSAQVLSGNTSRTYTIVDVAPGDDLRIGVAAPAIVPALGRVGATGIGRVIDADYYFFGAPCVSYATGDPMDTGLAVTVPGDCGGNPVDFVMLAATAGRRVLAYRIGLDVVVAGPQTLDLGPWLTDVQTFTLTLANPFAGELQAWAGARSNGRRLLTNSARNPTVDTREMTVPPGLDAYDYRVVALDTGRVSTLVRYLPGALEDTTVDVSAELLPLATDPTLDARTIKSLSSDATLDGVIVRIQSNAGDASAEWFIVLPPGVTTFTLPTLPSAWRDPLALAEQFIDVYYYDSDFTPDYATFRATAHTTDPHDPFGYIDTVPAGVTGRTRVSHTAN